MSPRKRFLLLALLALFAGRVAYADLPRLTTEAWAEDLEAMVRTLAERHPHVLHETTEEMFFAEAHALRARLRFLEPHQIVVELAALANRVGDGHTGIPLLSSTLDFHYYPLRLVLHADGLWVHGATREFEELLGARVLGLGGFPVDEAIVRVRPVLMGDNAWSRRALLGPTLVIGEVLHALGLGESPTSVAVTLVDSEGRVRTVRLDSQRDDAIRDFVLGYNFVGLEADPDRFVTVESRLPTPPVWRSRDDAYWFRILESHQTLFVQINQMDDRGEETLAELFARALQAGHSAGAERLVIDLRRNDGGSHIHNPLVHAILRDREFNESGSLFVLIGPGTFSAAQTFASALEEHTEAIFVGEPTGGRPNHYGEGGAFFLPNSGLRVRHSRKFFQNAGPSDSRDALAPHLFAPILGGDALGGRDPALEAIHGWSLRPALFEMMTDAYEQGGLDRALSTLHAFRANPLHLHLRVERTLNRFGYHLLGMGHPHEAVEIFRMNAAMHPQSVNVHDSLGEGLAALGHVEEAARAFERVLELDPADRNAPRQLERLRTPR